MWPGSNGAITRRILHIVSAEKQRAKESGVVGLMLSTKEKLIDAFQALAEAIVGKIHQAYSVNYDYHVVDVFTEVALEGNALAVFPDATGLDGATMQLGVPVLTSNVAST